MIVTAVVVSLIAVAFMVSTPPVPPVEADPVSFGFSAPTGALAVAFVHMGGAPVAASSYTATISSGGVVLYHGPLASSQVTWSYGDEIRVGLAQPIADGSKVTVTLVREGTPASRVIQPTARLDDVRFVGPELNLPLTIVVRFGNGLDRVAASGTDVVLIEAPVDHVDGRKMILNVSARMDGTNITPIALRDDGTLGDRVSGDGIFSGQLRLPLELPSATYALSVHAIDLYGHQAQASGAVEFTAKTPRIDPATFTVVPKFATGTNWTEIAKGGTVYVDAVVTHPAGNRFVANVSATLVNTSVSPFALRDDGVSPDSVANDSRYSGYLVVPVQIPQANYTLRVSATDLWGNTMTGAGMVRVLPPGQAPEGNAAANPWPATPIGPPATVLASGGLRAECNGQVIITVLGANVTYGAGGPNVPVYVNYTKNANTQRNLFGTIAVGQGMSYYDGTLTAGDILGFTTDANLNSYHVNRKSYVSDNHVVVLLNGQPVPNVPAFDGQTPLQTYLGPYVLNGKMNLSWNEAIVLVEFTDNLSSAAADFQDLVLLVKYPHLGCPLTTTSNKINFVGEPIKKANVLWFNNNVNLKDIPAGTTLKAWGTEMTWSTGLKNYTVKIPNGIVRVNASATNASTTWDNATQAWVTVSPPGTRDVFVTGFGWRISDDLPPNMTNVMWRTTFTSPTANISVKWKWGAAVYTQFTDDFRMINVYPTDVGTAQLTKPGVPLAFVDYHVPGAGTEGSGGNFNGGWSSTVQTVAHQSAH